jgi:hypothetical protein
MLMRSFATRALPAMLLTGLASAAYSAGQDDHARARPSYNMSELRYVVATIDDHGTKLDGRGFKAEGSLELGERFHLFGGYEDLGYDGHVDGKEVELGAGMRFGMASGLDLVTRVAYVDEKFHGHSADGYAVGVGVRKLIGAGGEMLAGVRQVELSGASQTVFEVGGEIHVTKRLALGLAVVHSDLRTAYTFSSRFYFGGH